MSSIAERRLKRELEIINLPSNFKIINVKNIYNWIIEFKGPENTPYMGGTYYFCLFFPHNYPFGRPSNPIFLNKIFHSHIGIRGTPCNCFYDEIFQGSWSHTLKVEEIITKISDILKDPLSKSECAITSVEGLDEKIRNSIINNEYKEITPYGKFLIEQKNILTEEDIEIMNLKKGGYKSYYVLENEIGKGTFCSVLKASEFIGELRAIKIINKNEIKNYLKEKYINDVEEIEKEYNKYIDNYVNEASIMKICNTCENSIRFFEYYNNENEFVFVMEFCDGNLMSLIEQKKVLEKEEIYHILIQLNNIFKLMKEKNIIHRDLKPQNILISKTTTEKFGYRIKLADYGVSKKLNNLKQMCTTFAGTILTMAPEILNGEEYTYKCDLWSLGIIIYLLVFGKYPYIGDTQNAILNNIKSFGKLILQKTEDENLNNLIFSLLEINPEKRLDWEQYFAHPFFKNNY